MTETATMTEARLLGTEPHIFTLFPKNVARLGLGLGLGICPPSGILEISCLLDTLVENRTVVLSPSVVVIEEKKRCKRCLSMELKGNERSFAFTLKFFRVIKVHKCLHYMPIFLLIKYDLSNRPLNQREMKTINLRAKDIHEVLKVAN